MRRARERRRAVPCGVVAAAPGVGALRVASARTAGMSTRSRGGRSSAARSVRGSSPPPPRGRSSRRRPDRRARVRSCTRRRARIVAARLVQSPPCERGCPPLFFCLWRAPATSPSLRPGRRLRPSRLGLRRRSRSWPVRPRPRLRRRTPPRAARSRVGAVRPRVMRVRIRPPRWRGARGPNGGLVAMASRSVTTCPRWRRRRCRRGISMPAATSPARMRAPIRAPRRTCWRGRSSKTIDRSGTTTQPTSSSIPASPPRWW